MNADRLVDTSDARWGSALMANDAGAPRVMGIVNVTPDSFSDGGRYPSVDAAVAHGVDLRYEGADIVDVGGQSTRPGAHHVSPEEECSRVIPVVTGLAADGVPVSIDTMNAEVARACVAAGACMVNDVSGGMADPRMLTTVAELGVDYVIMHWRADGSGAMTHVAGYRDVLTDVRDEISQRIDAAIGAGIPAGRIIIDPGLGFAKEAEDNWTLLAGLAAFLDFGLPVLIGASRKRFLGALLADDHGVARPVSDRDVATAAVSVLAAQAGVWGVRVHDVRATVDALKVNARWRQHG